MAFPTNEVSGKSGASKLRKLRMKFLRLVGFGLGSVAGLVLLMGAKAPEADKLEARIQRGEYLVKLGGCTDCHTPKKMGANGPEDDASRFLSGHPEEQMLPTPPDLTQTPWFAATAGMTAWTGPWGISYASNLTPDENTGLGIWTEEIFVKAMRTGQHYGEARPILPPMPWQNLAGLTDEDLKSIYAYLRTIRPVKNRVPEPVPPGGARNFE